MQNFLSNRKCNLGTTCSLPITHFYEDELEQEYWVFVCDKHLRRVHPDRDPKPFEAIPETKKICVKVAMYLNLMVEFYQMKADTEPGHVNFLWAKGLQEEFALAYKDVVDACKKASVPKYAKFSNHILSLCQNLTTSRRFHDFLVEYLDHMCTQRVAPMQKTYGMQLRAIKEVASEQMGKTYTQCKGKISRLRKRQREKLDCVEFETQVERYHELLEELLEANAVNCREERIRELFEDFKTSQDEEGVFDLDNLFYFLKKLCKQLYKASPRAEVERKLRKFKRKLEGTEEELERAKQDHEAQSLEFHRVIQKVKDELEVMTKTSQEFKAEMTQLKEELQKWKTNPQEQIKRKNLNTQIMRCASEYEDKKKWIVGAAEDLVLQGNTEEQIKDQLRTLIEQKYGGKYGCWVGDRKEGWSYFGIMSGFAFEVGGYCIGIDKYGQFH